MLTDIISWPDLIRFQPLAFHPAGGLHSLQDLRSAFVSHQHYIRKFDLIICDLIQTHPGWHHIGSRKNIHPPLPPTVEQ